MWSTRTATTSVGGTDAIIGVHGTELVLIEQDTAGANRTKPYDIGTDTWGANRAAYAGNGGGHGAYGPSMCQSGNLIYLISGEATTGTVDSGNNSLETWVYDMGADTWTRLHDLDVGFWSAGCDVGADGLIYCIGGTRDAAGPGFEGIVRVYDPGSDTWDTTRAAPPLPPITGALQFLNFPALAGLPDGRLLYGGGIPSDGSDTGAFWLYDPGTDTFTPTTDSSTASNMSWSILDLGNDAPAKNGNDIYVGSGAWSSFAKFTL
jgi:hypothetical protein